MPTTATHIRSRDGGEFDCYLVMPETGDPVPAVVLASAVHGVDADIRAIADDKLPAAALRHCVALALTYHLNNRKTRRDRR